MKSIKHQKSKAILIIFIILQTTYSLCTGQVASSKWPLAGGNYSPEIDGEITSPNARYFNLSNVINTSTSLCFNPASSFSSTQYVQFEVAPLPENNFILNTISSFIYSTEIIIKAKIAYSFSSAFSFPQYISPDISTSTVLKLYSFTDLGITVPEGEKLYIRLFPYGSNRTDVYFIMRDFTLEGYTTSTAPLSIFYNKETWCTGEGTAEVNLTGTTGGSYSSSDGLDINSLTGSINLLNSQPGDYTISYIAPGEDVATTDITVLQTPDCTIAGTDGPVYASTIHTFSAPPGMSLYSWSVSGNASATGSMNTQTVTVKAGDSSDASFNLSLAIEDVYSCNSTCSKEINVIEAPPGILPTATLTGTQSICAGSSADLKVTLTGQAPWTFTWTDGDEEYTVSQTYDSQHILSVAPTRTTTYRLTGQVSDGTGYTIEATGEATIYCGPVTSVPEIITCPNTTVDVPIHVKSFIEVRDISLSLKYDPSAMTYKGFENGDIAFGEEETGVIYVEDVPFDGEFHILRISKTSDENLPSLPDDAILLWLNFDFTEGRTGLEWVDWPDDAWCSYSFLSALDETGFETEAFCDRPSEAYYIDGSVKELGGSGTDVSPVADISTITGTPVIIPLSVTYPDLTTQDVNPEEATDIRLTYGGTGTFPAGTRLLKINSNGNTVLSTPYDIGELKEVFLNDVLETEAIPLMNCSGQTVNWEIYMDGITSPALLQVTAEAMVFIDRNVCFAVQDAESFDVTFADASLEVSESVTVCYPEPLQLTAEIGYPDIINLNAAIKADAKITAAHAFPEGTVINWYYNNSTSGNFTLPETTNEIMLSAIAGTPPSPLQGHAGTDVWTFEIFNAGIMEDNEVTLEAVALLEGEYFTHSTDHASLTVNPLPEVTKMSIQTSTDENTWTASEGTLSEGYILCADPVENYHYLDILEFISTVETGSDFEQNAFYLNVNSVPAGFYEYWNALGVNESATGGWQSAMWGIINGEEPMFYVSYDGSDYKLIDGVTYRNENTTANFRIRGDYPAGNYTFIGTVTDVKGCVSEPFPVKLTLNSAPVITCPDEIAVINDPGNCGAQVSFAASATGYPEPVMVYTLPDDSEITSGYFFPVGTTTVTATAVNDCKTVSCTFEVTVTDAEAPVLTCPAEENIEVIMNNGCTYVHSGTDWDAIATDNCSVEELSYTLSGATTGTGLSLENIVFNPGITTIIWKATDSAYNENECSHTVTVSGITLTGTVSYYNDEGTLLDNVTVTLLEPEAGLEVATTVTNGNGEYSFADICPGTYEVDIITDRPIHSINSTDAGQVNAWNVAQTDGIWPSIEKVRYLAGDVNEDVYLDSGDAGAIQYYFLTLGTEEIFDKPWEFWKAYVPVNTQQNDNNLQIEIPAGIGVMNQDFYGLVSGDFNRSHVPEPSIINPLHMKSARITQGSVHLLKGDTLFAPKNSVLELPVRALSAMRVGAISLILEFPTEQLLPEDVYLNDDPNQPAGFNIVDEMLVIGWNSVNPVSVEAGEPLVTLRVRVTDTMKMPFFFRLADNPLNELADENMVVIDNPSLIMDGLAIKDNTTGINNSERHASIEMACWPNPFNGNISISYNLPEGGQVSLYLTHVTGNRTGIQPVMQQKAGKYLIEYDGSHLVPGVYTVALRLTDNNGLQRMKTFRIIKK